VEETQARMWRGLVALPLLLLYTLPPATQAESVGEKILRKIVKTCGVPTIKNVMRNLTVSPGDSARFHCKVDMKCMVSYIQWYHEMNNGSVKLLRTGATQGTPYSYSIRRVGPQDRGLYSCVAGNILGETVSTAFLDISRGERAVLGELPLLLAVLLHLLNTRTHRTTATQS